MSDQRLRELERVEPGSARHLLERLRVGEVTRERVGLAGYAGHAGAREVVHAAYWCDPRLSGQLGTLLVPAHFSDWTRGLTRWGEAVCVRAACAAARVALPVWCDSTRMSGRTGLHAKRVLEEGGCKRCSHPDGEGPGAAIVAAEAWLACPCEEHAEALDDHYGTTGAGEWIACLTRLVSGGEDLARVLGWAAEEWQAMAGSVTVRAAISASLITWALA